MRGTEVGNKLCHHLDAVTPQKTSVIIGKGGTERKKKSQYMYLTKDTYLEYTKNSYNSKLRLKSQLKYFECFAKEDI